MDVTDEGAIAAAIAAANLAFGGIDIVVNNAGISISKSLVETTVQDWDLQHDIMARGSFLVSREATKAMFAQKLGGDIIYISSKNSVFAGPNNVAYGSTKADQAHQVRLLAAELGEHGHLLPSPSQGSGRRAVPAVRDQHDVAGRHRPLRAVAGARRHVRALRLHRGGLGDHAASRGAVLQAWLGRAGMRRITPDRRTCRKNSASEASEPPVGTRASTISVWLSV